MSGGGARAAAYEYDVFINHRGVDTKHNVARLLYDRLLQLSGGRDRSFLDNKSMRPGDRLGASIDEGIRQCKVAVAIFSRRYFDSDYCLHELASIVEARKVIVPIFYGIKPSELTLPQDVVDCDAYTPRDIERFRLALREAKYTVGLACDPATGDLAELVNKAADAVMKRIQEAERVPRSQMIASRL
ncbi:hypothetical protein PVAP13_2KG494300 [Panicum virgatum]|uniref:TIR domain-containing protein n=1 Tax=Panicum virgatum TaxID=38727 RepID=A0A8T0WM33_PANVG|nr:hypothetical protein PVAP13_2KG494300 [Panicum virgatum]